MVDEAEFPISSSSGDQQLRLRYEAEHCLCTVMSIVSAQSLCTVMTLGPYTFTKSLCISIVGIPFAHKKRITDRSSSLDHSLIIPDIFMQTPFTCLSSYNLTVFLFYAIFAGVRGRPIYYRIPLKIAFYNS